LVMVMSAAVVLALLFQPDPHHEAGGAAPPVLIAPGLLTEDAQRRPAGMENDVIEAWTLPKRMVGTKTPGA
jgi:hypothetical protein